MLWSCQISPCHAVYPDPLSFPQLHLHITTGKRGHLEESRGGKCHLLLQHGDSLSVSYPHLSGHGKLQRGS